MMQYRWPADRRAKYNEKATTAVVLRVSTFFKVTGSFGLSLDTASTNSMLLFLRDVSSSLSRSEKLDPLCRGGAGGISSWSVVFRFFIRNIQGSLRKLTTTELMYVRKLEPLIKKLLAMTEKDEDQADDGGGYEEKVRRILPVYAL